MVGRLLEGLRRRRFTKRVKADKSGHAVGERTLELTEAGVRECSGDVDFVTRWDEVALVEVTAHHLFLAHLSMNAHIVPVRSFGSQAEQDAFVAYARIRASRKAV